MKHFTAAAILALIISQGNWLRAQEPPMRVPPPVEAAPMALIDDINGPAPTGSRTLSPEAQEAAPEGIVPVAPAVFGRDAALTTLEAMKQGFEQIVTVGYRGEMISEELIDGSIFRKRMQIYLRRNPRAIRIQFLEPDRGQVAVWQAGWDHFRVNPPGIIPTISLDPNGARAMATSHHPITEAGIDMALERYIDSIREVPEDADAGVEHIGLEQVGNQRLDRYDFHHPRVGDAPITSFTIWMDPNRGLPILFENRAADGSLYERYNYVDFEVNPPLSDDQFDM
jgi:hypothetical protein